MNITTNNPEIVVTINKTGNRFDAFDNDGNRYTPNITIGARKKAYNGDYPLGRFTNKSGKTYWKRVNPNESQNNVREEVLTDNTIEFKDGVDVLTDHTEVMNFIHSSFSIKPKGLVMKELKWKYLVRSAVRGKNIMMTGMAGCGKTMAAKALVNALDRTDYYFNLGATQDPRSTLIGNTHFNKDTGTYFAESLFVKAIRTPNAVILLDELTRAHPDAWNILMSVLDQGQKYLRLDEQDNAETVKVADGVTFIATANIGNEYTATRVLDRALLDRFTIIEMDILNNDEEFELLNYMFPSVDKKSLKNISEIAHLTRIESRNDAPRIESGISTRTSVEMAGLIFDGFNLEETAEITIYPQYSADGGVDSERTFVKQIVQKFCDDGTKEDVMFSEEEIKEATGVTN
ncbi:MAG: AAA family ATPase [Candidatus Pelagibacter sp.]|nr:AAA family ATPase [Candidatus Pelagibacter sp.]